MYKIIGADGKEYGPISTDILRKWLAEGRVNAQTKVLPEGTTDWKALGDVPELAAAIPTVAPITAATPASAATANVPDYLVQSILVTLCCCLPFGIAAIVFAAQVKSKLGVGDVAGAMESSRKAKMWCWIAFGVGIVVNLIVLVLNLLPIMLGAGGSMGN